MNESAPQGVTIHLGRDPETGEVLRVDAPAAPLAAPLVAVPPIDLQAISDAPSFFDCALCSGRGFYGIPGARCSFCRGTGKLRGPGAATPPAPLQGQSAALPSDEAHIQHVEYWADAYTNPSGDDSHFCGHPIAGKLLTEYAALLRRASLPLPAPAGVEGGEKQESGHPAVNDSPSALRAAPLQEPCALDRPELPVRLRKEAP